MDLEQLGQPCCQLLRMGRVEDERSPPPRRLFKKICHVKARIKPHLLGAQEEPRAGDNLGEIDQKSGTFSGLHFEGTPKFRIREKGTANCEQDLKNPNFKPNDVKHDWNTNRY